MSLKEISGEWIVNPLLRTYDVTEGSHIVELDDRHGRTMRMRLTSDAMQLLGRFHSSCSWATYRAELIAAGVDSGRLDRIGEFLAGPCRKKSILVSPGEFVVADEQASKPPYLTAMMEIVPWRVVNVVSSFIHPLFSLPAFVLAGGMIFMAVASMFLAMHERADAPTLDVSRILTVGIVSAIGIVLHELGHAAAAYRLGARRVSIGIGWYLVIPVAYSELSELWRYPRQCRVAVNLAGVYMQGLVIVVLMLLFHAEHDPVWLVAAVATATSILWNLNPFVRMDGYWVVADALDCPDLRQRAGAQLSNAIRRPFVSNRVEEPDLSWMLIVYAALSAVFIGWLLMRSLAFLVDIAMLALPAAGHRLMSVSLSEVTAAEWALALISLLWQLMLTCLVARFMASVPKRLRAWWRRGDLQ